jgi:hypothetical protein
MNEYIILSIFAAWFAELSSLPDKLVYLINFASFIINGSHSVVDRIPLIDCAKCLSFWLTLIYGLINGLDWWAFPVAGVCSLIAMFTVVLYKRIKGGMI